MNSRGDLVRPDIRTTRVRPLPASACSAQWDRGDLPAWGTAAQARFWVALEQPGPWGHDAFAASHLDPELGQALAARVASAGGRALLIRQPGCAGDARVRRPRQVFLAAGVEHERPTLLSGRVEDPASLLDLPWDVLRTGAVPPAAALPGLREDPTSVALICTNAKRDACCALRGLPLAAALARSHPGRVWECSHTGGHRFAPTGVILPSGATLGRLDVPLGEAALTAPAHELADAVLDPAVLRGLAHLAPRDQAVDAFARIRWGLRDVRQPVRIDWEGHGAGPDAGVAAVEGTDSALVPQIATLTATAPVGTLEQVLRVAVTEQTDPTARSVSCGRDPGPSTYVEITELA